MTDLPLRCQCGQFQGVLRDLSPGRVNRVVCYCKFCVAYAGSLGRADDVLDELGGSEVLQTSPAFLEITQGADKLACGRLSSSGPLRWYAECCKTPFANTLATPGLPFMGVVCGGCLSHDAVSESADLAPIRARVNHQLSKADARRLGRAGGLATMTMYARFTAMMLKWKLGGHDKRSPFFRDGAPIAEPTRLQWPD